MFVNQTLGGSGLVKRQFLAGEEMLTAGVPLIGTGAMAAGANEGGVQVMAASAQVEAVVGLLLDAMPASSYPSDKDGQVNSDASVLVNVIVNPDAVYKAKIAQSTTADVALTALTMTAASAAGHDNLQTIVAGDAVWFLTGANVGAYPRRAADTTTVAISFPNAIGASDTYATVSGFPGLGIAAGQFDLTTDFTQIDATTVITDGNFVHLDFAVNDASNDGVNNSHLLIMARDHVFGGNQQA